MRNVLAIAFVLASLGSAVAQDTTEFPKWNDVLQTCSAEYKERADKAKGREIWQEFLSACKARKGFVAKKDQNKREFNRIPDKS
jgi:hypothetical protein